MAISFFFAGCALVGAFGGCFYGFVIAAHHAASQGEVDTTNRFLRLMTMTRDSWSLDGAIVLLSSLACSCLVFLGVIFTPGLLMSWLSLPAGPDVQVGFVALFGAGFVGWRLGKRLWWVVS